MCKKIFLSSLFSIVFFFTYAQFNISGKLTSTKNEALEGVSITIKDSYFGTTSGKDGSFQFQVTDTLNKRILFTQMGFKPLEKELNFSNQSIILQIQLKEEITELKAVVITAGTFEASDKKRNTVLKSIDVVTTAGQQADVVAALKTLPGAQQIGEQEGLFVRGGTGAETKVFIDGMMVTNPFFSSVPGIAQRSRFSPLLFKGTVFSAGGYSAQYGQGLSSALILESIDLPSRSEVNMIVSSPQVSFMGQKLNKSKSGSMGLNITYQNLAPYYSIVSQKYHYTKAPETFNTEFNLRRKTKNGIFKFYTYLNNNKVGFERQSLDYVDLNEQFTIQNKNVFSNATYTGRLGNNWNIYGGASLSINHDKIDIRTRNDDTTVFTFLPHISNKTSQGKLVFTKNFAGLSKLYIGTEYQNLIDKITAKDSIQERKIIDNYVAGFVESDIYFSAKLVSKIGIRYEHSSLLNQPSVAPRVSIAYKLNKKSQFSFAYGSFYQKPETNYMFRNTNLGFTKASHYVANFQKVYNGQTLRVEAFKKDYKNLTTINANNPSLISNNGSGYAKGIELFWRDKKNIKNLDYWIAYSLLDTKRQYLSYPKMVQPSFAAKHTLNVVAKRWVNSISTNLSATYTLASGRPYYNPNKNSKEFMSDRTMSYQSLGLQANYLRTIGKMNAVFIVNVSNALGSKQVFGYRFSGKADAEGNYKSEAVTPMAKRFVFVGMYLSIGADRRKNILD